MPMLTHQVRVTTGMEAEGPSDGFRWVKHAQTDIPGAESPRVYYVCTPQNVGGCMAIKEVQPSNDKEILKITYRGRHTCTLASTSNGGKVDSSTSVPNGASSVHDQVVQSPSSPGANGHGGNVTRVTDNPLNDNNMIVLQDASSQDMEPTPSNVAASVSSQPVISSPSLTQVNPQRQSCSQPIVIRSSPNSGTTVCPNTGMSMKTKSVPHKAKPMPKPATKTSTRARAQQGPKEGSNKKMWKP